MLKKIRVRIFVGYFCVKLIFGPNFAYDVITTMLALAIDNSALERAVSNSGAARVPTMIGCRLNFLSNRQNIIHVHT